MTTADHSLIAREIVNDLDSDVRTMSTDALLETAREYAADRGFRSTPADCLAIARAILFPWG